MKCNFTESLLFVLACIAVFSFAIGVTVVNAQKPRTVARKGDTLYHVKPNRPAPTYVKTKYFYEDAKGNKDTIFVSSNRKCFVFKTSKSGHRYRKYLPEMNEVLYPQTNENKGD